MMAAVYRIYSDDGPLYFGMSTNVQRRLEDHSRRQPWWPAVTRVEIDQYDTEAEASAGECQAIRRETPRYNRAGVTTPYVAPQTIEARAASRARNAVERALAAEAARVAEVAEELERAEALEAIRLLTRQGAAEALGVPVAELDAWRAEGQGPAWLSWSRHKSAVRYQYRDLCAWQGSQRVAS